MGPNGKCRGISTKRPKKPKRAKNRLQKGAVKAERARQAGIGMAQNE